MPCYNLCWTLNKIQSLCRTMVGWRSLWVRSHESSTCNVTTRTKDEANKWNQVERQGEKRRERELKTKKRNKLTKLYIITYTKSKSTKTILTIHYEKMKNQIKIRIEVATDNHSKNLKNNQETLCHFDIIMQTFKSSITCKEEGFWPLKKVSFLSKCKPFKSFDDLNKK